MSTRALPIKHLAAAIAHLVTWNGCVTAAAREWRSPQHPAGAPRQTFTNWIEQAKRVGITVPAPQPFPRPPLVLSETPVLHVPEEGVGERERRRWQDERYELRAQLTSAQREINDLEDIRHGLLGLVSNPPPPLRWDVAPAVHTKTVLLPALFTSDFQCGEVIRPDEIDGINEYNMDVFSSRYQALIERTVDISNNHVGQAEFPGIIYLRGGDAISGEIHDELAQTNDLSAVPAVRHLVRHEREGIKQLKSRFGRVDVYSIPGNHGRTTEKSHAKGYVNLNFETIVAWWLETLFEDDPNVRFFTPASGDAYFDALGWKTLMSHGDRMGSRGGQGFIGPAATIMRGHRKLYDNFTRTGKPVHYILTGHLHTSLMLSLGFANGALCGYGEYARDLRADPDAAKQWLLYFHEKRGVSAHYEVQLSDRPQRLISDEHLRMMAE